MKHYNLVDKMIKETRDKVDEYYKMGESGKNGSDAGKKLAESFNNLFNNSLKPTGSKYHA